MKRQVQLLIVVKLPMKRKSSDDTINFVGGNFSIERGDLFMFILKHIFNKRFKIITYVEEKTSWWTMSLIYYLG